MPKLLYIGAGLVMAYAALPKTNFAHVNDFDGIILAKSAKYGVPYVVLKGLIAVESGFQNAIKNPTSSAFGLTQVIKSTAEGMGYDYAALGDPEVSIDAGANYLSRQMERFGLVGGIRAYYTGPWVYETASAGKLLTLSEARQKHYQYSLTYVGHVMAYAAAFAVKDVGVWL